MKNECMLLNNQSFSALQMNSENIGVSLSDTCLNLPQKKMEEDSSHLKENSIFVPITKASARLDLPHCSLLS